MPEAAHCITGPGTAGLCWAENKSGALCSGTSSTARVGPVPGAQCLARLRARLPCVSSRPETTARCSGQYYQVPCHVPSLCQVCATAVCCVQHLNSRSNESTCRGVKTCSCCCCCFPHAPPSKETETGLARRGLISRLAESCHGTKVIWRKVLYVLYRLRQVRHKVCAKMGHLQELRHRLRRVRKASDSLSFVCKQLSTTTTVTTTTTSTFVTTAKVVAFNTASIAPTATTASLTCASTSSCIITRPNVTPSTNPPARHSSTAAKMWNSVTECCLKIVNHFSRRKSVLYVCEGMNNSMGDAMAAAARDRNTRYQSVQQDTTLGFPYQVQRPDGEERYPSKKPLPAPDQVFELPTFLSNQEETNAKVMVYLHHATTLGCKIAVSETLTMTS
ncbi:hypothetical protein GWK47_017030 [Chionoecetes opilio]|uniref:Uncharacterized protein n=1 Tax=Chionoecetes opilio TaxID=41210 RepID=A0A8J4XU57_CHIOP|nr:hypothetical protein GWK47_017030 [Chionoecetes opilio]